MDPILPNTERAQVRSRSWRFWVSLLLPLVLIGSFAWFAVRTNLTKRAAEQEATLFHRRAAAGQYDAIYDAADPQLRGIVKRQDLNRHLTTVNDRLGACRMPNGATSAFVDRSSGTTVELTYRLECAKGPLEETLLFAVEGGRARLMRYRAGEPERPK